MHSIWLLAAIAGVAVVISSTVARHVGGAWAGVLAAAPITPTFSAILLGDQAGGALLNAVPLVVATLCVMLLLLLLRHPMVAVLPGAAVLVLLVLPAPWRLAEWIGLGVVVAAAARLIRPQQRSVPRGRLPMAVRFAIGAGVVLAVGLVKATWPALAGWIAMAPWLFIAAVAAAALDGGWSGATRVLHGGIGGALGVIAFAVALAAAPGLAWGLPLAWLAFVAVSLLWCLLPQDASMPWPTSASSV